MITPIQVASLVFLTVTIAFTVYVVRRLANGTAAASCDALRSERGLELHECAQREAQACGTTSEVCRTLDELVLQARESLRARVESLEAGAAAPDSCPVDTVSEGCKSDVETIETLLFQQRAIMPPVVFGLTHDVRTHAVAFEATVRRLSGDPRARERQEELSRLREQFEQVDRLYGDLDAQVHDFLGACACSSV